MKGLYFWMPIILFFIFLVVENIYSTETGKDFCKEKGMELYELNQINPFDLKDDVICYLIVDNEFKLFYFRR